MRQVAEIEAEIAAKRAAGVHHSSRDLKPLYAELKAAKAPVAAGSATRSEVAGVYAPGVETFTDAPNSVAVDGDEEMKAELDFVEKCLVQIVWEPKGVSSAPVKNLYETIEYKVKVWRMTRGIIKGGCLGKSWPKWATLGRDESTGELENAKPPKPAIVRDEPAAPPAPVTSTVAPSTGTPVTMEAMMAMFAQMQAKQADPMEQFKRSVAAEIGKSVATVG